MALTVDERADVERLIAHVRGLAMGFAAIDPSELARLERLAVSAVEVAWIIDPTVARDRRRIDRHARLMKACAAFGREMRAVLLDEIEEMRGGRSIDG